MQVRFGLCLFFAVLFAPVYASGVSKPTFAGSHSSGRSASSQKSVKVHECDKLVENPFNTPEHQGQRIKSIVVS